MYSSISEATLARTAACFPGVRLTQCYGLTEMSPVVSILKPHDHDPVADRRRLRSAGRPLIGVEVKVLDPEGRECPRKVVGELAARGIGAMQGYWNAPEQSAAALRDGWVMTGDGAYVDDDGYLFIVDRVKDMIVSGGENVYSAEVEQALAKHPAVQSCAVVGLPDAKWGEAVTAVVVLRQGAQATASEIITHCRGLIAAYKAPKQVHFALSLPMTSSGKIMKREVRALYLRDRSADQKA